MALSPAQYTASLNKLTVQQQKQSAALLKTSQALTDLLKKRPGPKPASVAKPAAKPTATKKKPAPAPAKKKKA